MYHIKREQFLKWMRASFDAINAEIFNGELPPITINVENLKGTDFDAFYEASQRVPRGSIILRIVIGLHNAYFEETDTILYPVILIAHEMIHLYCFLHNIKDTDPNGYHNEHFLQAAESHGMYCREWTPEIGFSDIRLTLDQIDRTLSHIPSETLDDILKNMTLVPDFPYQLKEYRNIEPQNG